MQSTKQDDIPASERGKEEKMTIDKKEPGAAFALVGMSYMVVLVVAIAVFGAYFLLFA